MIDHVYLFVSICTWFIFCRATFLSQPSLLSTPCPFPFLNQSVNMNVTAQEILGHLIQLDTAICDGLRAGNIKTVMEAQKMAMVRARPPFRQVINSYLF